jgi:hypothetical protein
MTTRPRRIHLSDASYNQLAREAKQRGVEPDELADELLRAELGAAASDLETALTRLAEFRAGLPEIDGLALARHARRDLEHRGA